MVEQAFMIGTQLSPSSKGHEEERDLSLLAITGEQRESTNGRVASWVMSLACPQIDLPSTAPIVVTLDAITKKLAEALSNHAAVLVVPWELKEVASIVEIATLALHSASTGEIRSSRLPLPVPLIVEGALVEVERSSPQSQLAPFVFAYPGWQHVLLLSSGTLRLAVLSRDGSMGNGYAREKSKTALLEAMVQRTSPEAHWEAMAQGPSPSQGQRSDGDIYATYLSRIIANTVQYLCASEEADSSWILT